MLTVDMLVRSGVEGINIFSPYSLYQREDKKDEGAVPIGAAVWFKMIEERCKGRLNRIITYDLHAGQAQAFIDRPVDHLSAVPYFTRYLYSEYFARKFGADAQFTFYSPDPGGIKRVRKLALLLNSPYGDVDKYRRDHGESVAGQATDLDCREKVVVILDDIVDTTTTICEAGDKLYKCGASKIIAMAPHGVLSDKPHDVRPLKALDKLHDAGIRLVITDSIPRDMDFYNHPAIEDVLSLAAPTAEIQLLRRLNFSVSSTLASLNLDIKSRVDTGKRYENIEQYLLPLK
jgi:ribose-phosphate pyrophosphokinase